MLQPLMKMRAILMTGRMLKIVDPHSLLQYHLSRYILHHLLEERSNQEKGIMKKVTFRTNYLRL